ncbi:MAG TPA: hypothetical protein VLC74_04855 [Rhizomicrobium sp.]|nr:hypothetical protein [Rhizomicrobium sp.]
MICGGDLMQRAAGKAAVQAGIHFGDAERRRFFGAHGEACRTGNLPTQSFQACLPYGADFSHSVLFSFSTERAKLQRVNGFDL